MSKQLATRAGRESFTLKLTEDQLIKALGLVRTDTSIELKQVVKDLRTTYGIGSTIGSLRSKLTNNTTNNNNNNNINLYEENTKYSTNINLMKGSMKFLEYWNLHGGVRHTRKGTKVRETSLLYIDLLRKGEFFTEERTPHVYELGLYIGRKFTFREWQVSVNNFELAAWDNSYYPPDKNVLRRIGLPTFLFNPYSKNATFASMFLFYLKNRPSDFIALKQDLNTSVTVALTNLYLRKTRRMIKTEMITRDRNNMIMAVRKLMQVLEDNKDAVNVYLLNSPKKKAELLWNCVMHYLHDDISKVTPYTLQKDWVFERLPAYALQKGYFVEGQYIA